MKDFSLFMIAVATMACTFALADISQSLRSAAKPSCVVQPALPKSKGLV